MNSTTGDKRVPLSRIVLLSAALQTAGALAFYWAEPLRTSRLTAGETRDVRTVDRAAEARLRKVEQQRRVQRERTALKPEEAEAMTRKAEQEIAADITEKLKDMQDIRASLVLDEAAGMTNLAARTVADVGLSCYDRIHPLATQLVANAESQRAQAPLSAGPEVTASSAAFLAMVEGEREKLLEPAVFERLRGAHRQVQDTQQRYIGQLDEAQSAYAADLDRIRRENHVEYLVNLMRDRIAEILWEAAEFDTAGMNDLPDDYAVPPPLPEDWATQLAGKPVAELHAEAQSLYRDIQQLFAGTRAAHLALEQNLAMSNAYEKINVPGPAPTFSPGGPPGSPATLGDVNNQIADLGRAAQDVNRLWQSARNLGAAGSAMVGLAGAPAGGPPDGAPGGGHGNAARSVGANSAAAGRAGRFADMTPFMYAGGGGGERGFGSANAGGGDITRHSICSGYAETGANTPGAKGPPLLSEAKVLKEALPGRKFSRNSPRTGWLYIDTWYVIGPWENKGRVGFAEAQPPETLVDLDATYEGKDGRTLAWQFHQSDNIRIKPPAEMESSTYYGYTEVYFDEEMEMLVAVASDDAAKVWLNDQLIWQDDGIGPWRLDEGFRKVIFRKGFNTLLVRVENGPITCTYSILLCPPEVVLGNRTG